MLICRTNCIYRETNYHMQMWHTSLAKFLLQLGQPSVTFLKLHAFQLWLMVSCTEADYFHFHTEMSWMGRTLAPNKHHRGIASITVTCILSISSPSLQNSEFFCCFGFICKAGLQMSRVTNVLNHVIKDLRCSYHAHSPIERRLCWCCFHNDFCFLWFPFYIE